MPLAVCVLRIFGGAGGGHLDHARGIARSVSAQLACCRPSATRQLSLEGLVLRIKSTSINAVEAADKSAARNPD